MNEHIKNLAEQAGEAVVTQLFEEFMITETSDGATLQVPAIFIEKFAELIVTKCAVIVSRCESDGKGNAGAEILDTFGVK